MRNSRTFSPPPRNQRPRMRSGLIAGWLAVALAGCATHRAAIEYIPADRALSPLKKGDPAPADGWFVPPAVLQELLPDANQRFQDD